MPGLWRGCEASGSMRFTSLYSRGHKPGQDPAWERRGVMIYRKGGQVAADWDIPLFSSKEGVALLAEIIGPLRAGSKS